jgi:hypothetical protein
MSTKAESGLRKHRPEFVRENVDSDGDPETPTDPEFEKPSDRVYNIDPGFGPGLEADRGLGDIDTDEHEKGPEEHELTIEYALQRWFVDDNGDAHDLAGDGVLRDSDGLLPNTHTFLDREQKGTVAAMSTVEGQVNGKSGATGKSTRIFTVGKGGKIVDVTLTVDPGDQQPARVEVTYQFEKMRRYQVDQPDSETLHVQSTDPNDTSQTLSIEDEGANTTEDISLNGTTAVATTSNFDDIDVLELDAETDGDIEVYDDAGSPGELLAVLDGADSYDGIEGDHGIPALGSGSRASAIGNDYLRTLTDSITRSGSSDYWFEINSKELSIDNGLSTQMRDDSLRMRIQEGTRETEMSVSTYGETQSYTDIRRSLTNDGADIVWTFPDVTTGQGTITLSTAKLTDPGTGPYEAEQSQMTIDETFAPEGGGTSALTIA